MRLTYVAVKRHTQSRVVGNSDILGCQVLGICERHTQSSVADAYGTLGCQVLCTSKKNKKC